LNENEKAIQSAKKVLQIDPAFSCEYHKNVLPYRDQAELDKHIENLRKAGLPE